MADFNLPAPINEALSQVDKLSHTEHFFVILITQIVVQLVLALINYFGFTINPKTNYVTMFQWFILTIRSTMGGITKGNFMPEFLEGNEYEHKIGKIGQAVVDVTPDLKLKVLVGVEIDIMAELKKLAAKTQTKLDDQFLEIVEGILTKSAQMDEKAMATLSTSEGEQV